MQADYVAAGEGPVWDPIWLDAGEELHPAGVLIHPAAARACASNTQRVVVAGELYAKLRDHCRQAVLAVPDAVPDPVVLRCPECPVAGGDLWRERLLVGGGGLLVGLVGGVLLALAVGG